MYLGNNQTRFAVATAVWVPEVLMYPRLASSSLCGGPGTLDPPASPSECWDCSVRLHAQLPEQPSRIVVLSLLMSRPQRRKCQTGRYFQKLIFKEGRVKQL